MSVFPGFGSWINQNMQQPPKAESTRSEDVKAKEEVEMRKQGKLWKDAEKKHPWYDPPATVKVNTKKGLCHMHIELTLGYPPEVVYELITNPQNLPIYSDKSWRQIMKNNSRKVLSEDGSRKIVKSEKEIAWDFLWWSGALPITLILDENDKYLRGSYKKEKMMFMKRFEGKWKVEPLYVDSERLCNHKSPKSREEYRKCSGGQGRIASKVIIDQYFQPYTLFNLPPVSWYIRWTTIKTTKTLLKLLQHMSFMLRTNTTASE